MFVGYRILEPVENRPELGCVYYLRCPITDAIRYVGSTIQVQVRYASHVSHAMKLMTRNIAGTKKDEWIISLLKQGRFPVLEVVVVLEIDQLSASELYHYRKLILDGCDLVNGNTPNRTQKPGKRNLATGNRNLESRPADIESPFQKAYREQASA